MQSCPQPIRCWFETWACWGGYTQQESTVQHVTLNTLRDKCLLIFASSILQSPHALHVLYLHQHSQMWEVKYQQAKVTGISYLPHDCLPNCSSFSHLQDLMGARVFGARVRPPRPKHQCLPRLVIHAKHMVSLYTSPSPSCLLGAQMSAHMFLEGWRELSQSLDFTAFRRLWLMWPWSV